MFSESLKQSKHKFSCKYSRFGIRKIGCSMTWARHLFTNSIFIFFHCFNYQGFPVTQKASGANIYSQLSANMSVFCIVFSWWIRQRRWPVWPASDYDLVGSGSRHTALFSLRLFQGCARIRESRYIPTGSSPTRRIQGPRYVNIYNYLHDGA